MAFLAGLGGAIYSGLSSVLPGVVGGILTTVGTNYLGDLVDRLSGKRQQIEMLPTTLA